MSKGIKTILGVVAAIAIPFVAGPIAAAIGFSGALGSAVVGAGLGAATSAATGSNPLFGAALGGLGGFAGGGGFQNLFGGAGGAAGAGAGGAAVDPWAGLRAVTPGAAVGTVAPTVAPTVAAQTGLGGFFQSVSQGVLNNPAGVAQLAMTVFGRSPQELTAAEQAQLEELKGIAANNRELFEQRVTEANSLLQQARQQAPNPEQAFAQTKIATERQLGEQTRGLGAEEARYAQRTAGIRSSQTGATAAAAEQARGTQAQTQLTQAGLSALPSSAPQGYAGMALPTYQALQERRDQYQRDLAKASGDLFGNIG